MAITKITITKIPVILNIKQSQTIQQHILQMYFEIENLVFKNVA